MIELDQIKYKLNTFETPLQEMKDALKLDNKVATIAELESSMEKADFWDDTQKSQEVMKQLKVLKQDVEDYKALITAKEDIDTLLEMGYEENDPELIPEIEEAMEEPDYRSPSYHKEYDEDDERYERRRGRYDYPRR